MRDLRNTFLFTTDALQITETQYKQFHPDIFHSPWVSVSVKGRVQVHIWAVVIIQRAFRNYVKRKIVRQQAKKKVSNTKERWKKKAEGDQYKPPSKPPSPPPRARQGKKTEPVKSKEEEEEEYQHRRRTDFMEDVSEDHDYTKTYYDNQKNPKGAVGAVFRRKKFEDLKSVQERKNEEKQIDTWLNM